jgi:hypothetical protein
MPANYVLLERIELNASTTSVTFANIPQTGYTDLKVVMSARTTRASTDDLINVNFNGVSTNQSSRWLQGNGTSASSGTYGSNLYLAWVNAASNTANTFGNAEMYIPNYLGTTQKSFSGDGVSENNATQSFAGLFAGLATLTSAITTITIAGNAGGSFVSGSTFSLYGLAAVGTTPTIAPKASGGNIITDGTYWYHTFLSTGAFVPQINLSCDIMVVAGGGGGGANAGGGGGAGGLVGFTSQGLSATSYTCTIGAGGTGASNNSGTIGTNGADSQFGSLTLVKGGGAGGNSADSSPYVQAAGANGGSGGGGAGRAGLRAGGTATSGQGNNGGSGNSDEATYRSCGGGGGAGAAGQSGANSNTSPAGGFGGVGSSSYSSWGSATGTGENVSGTYYYAGGGGGGNAAGLGAGGFGGGTAAKQTVTPTNAANNTGGCGGALSQFLASSQGENGGSGIIIIRYPVA